MTIDKLEKKYKCEEFLYRKQMNRLASMLAPIPNGHEINLNGEMSWKEDFHHDVCRDIVLEVVTHCIRESTIWKHEDGNSEKEHCEGCYIKDTMGER